MCGMTFALIEVDGFLPGHGEPLAQLGGTNVLQLQAGVQEFAKHGTRGTVRVSAFYCAPQDPEE